MLGGTKLAVAGPCYQADNDIVVKFEDDTLVSGSFSNELEATITVPLLNKTGTLPIQLSLDGGNTFNYNGEFTSGKTGLVKAAKGTGMYSASPSLPLSLSLSLSLSLLSRDYFTYTSESDLRS